jgi:ketosteroid isomerase-like protein
MTITVDIRPEVQVELARQAAVQGRALEAYAASLLEDAAHVPAIEPLTAARHQTGQSLIDAFADIRGLLSDEEIDRMFARNPSTARPVDLS